MNYQRSSAVIFILALFSAFSANAADCKSEHSSAEWLALSNRMIDLVGVKSLPAQDRRCWLEKTAKGGSLASKYLLGMEYLRSKDAYQSKTKGALLVKQVADGGDTFAQAVTALNYLDGVGLHKDRIQAFDYAAVSAFRGEAYGEYVLGRVIEDTGLMPFRFAMRWFERAAEKGIALAKDEIAYHDKKKYFGSLSEIFENNREGEKIFTVVGSKACPYDKLPEGESKYRAFLNCSEKAAKRGDVNAQSIVGTMWLAGFGTKRSDAIARYWLLQAASRGDGMAHWELGRMYQQGWGVQKSATAAIKHYSMAAEKGITPAPMRLHLLYSNSALVKSDSRKSEYWLQKAADAGNYSAQLTIGRRFVASDTKQPSECPRMVKFLTEASSQLPEAQSLLGKLSLNGICQEKNDAVAFERFEKAAKRGDALGMAYLAALYFHGMGTAKDWNTSEEWFQKAISTGLPEDALPTIYSFLGRIYLQSEKSEHSDLAADYLIKAANGRDPAAIDTLKELIKSKVQKKPEEASGSIIAWDKVEVVVEVFLAVCLVFTLGVRVGQTVQPGASEETTKTEAGILEKIPTGIRAQILNEASEDFLAKRIWNLPVHLRRRLVAGVSEDIFQGVILSKLSNSEVAELFRDLKLEVQDEIISALSHEDQAELLRSVPKSVQKYALAGLSQDERKKIESELGKKTRNQGVPNITSLTSRLRSRNDS